MGKHLQMAQNWHSIRKSLDLKRKENKTKPPFYLYSVLLVVEIVALVYLLLLFCLGLKRHCGSLK